MILIIIDIILNSFIESSFTLSFQSNFQVNYYFIVTLPSSSPFKSSSQASSSSWYSFFSGKLFPLDTAYFLLLSASSSGPLSFSSFFWVNLYLRRNHCFGERTEIGSRHHSEFWFWWLCDLEQFFLHFHLLSEVIIIRVRYLCYPVFYGFLLSFCFKVIEPSYYKP